uniref:NADH-ubiquinone oxidoreductase chain 6 n=1 Tax=Staphylinidae sp. BMNH 1274634 TaxID=1796578 RepID=A0A126TFQ5_9COLE|nr:NADH dehydrogenase subunit 6 [Staphylinidae sp. BMNH 1274634]
MYLMYLSMMMSIISIFMKHPLTLGTTLLFQTISISLISGFYMFNFWFSYILFLIMIGGMLILFIYMTSVASNEKFKFSNKITMFTMITTMMMFIMKQFIDSTYLNLTMSNLESINSSNLINNTLNKFINYPFNIILLFIIIYLFITLIAVVKISGLHSGPLRQKN